MTEQEKKVIKDSVKAHKEVLKYYKDNDLEENIHILLKHPKHSKYLKPLMEVIEAGRMVALNKKYKSMEDSVKINKLRTSKEGSNTTQWRRKQRAIKERLEKEVFPYPEGLPDELKETYRKIFKKHINSGMPKEMAQELTLRGLEK